MPRILHRYITLSFLAVLVVTVSVVTFVLCIMVLFSAVDLISYGAPWSAVVRILLNGLPTALGFAIPVSILTSALLCFGRLSAHGEITAMKSSGISVWQIIAGPVLIAIVLCACCLQLNLQVIPDSNYERLNVVRSIGVQTPLRMLEEGRFIKDFPGYSFYIGEKRGDKVYDVIIYQDLPDGKRRSIRAKSATIAAGPDQKSVVLDMFNVTMDPFYEDRPGRGQCERFPLTIDLSDSLMAGPKAKKKGDLDMGELVQQIRDVATAYPGLDAVHLASQKMILTVEALKRLTFSFSCLAFVLLGIPLGTKTQRQESSIGIAMSLVLVFVFYLFVIVAENLSRYPELHPQVIVCLPLFLTILVGLFLLHRCE